MRRGKPDEGRAINHTAEKEMVFVAAELESILVGAKEAWGREDWAIESLE